MSAFKKEILVRFSHCDPAGIVYYPRIYDYIHEVFEDVWEEHVAVRYSDLIMRERIGFPLVHSEVEFKSPLRFGDRPEVRATCFELGTASFGLRYRFFLGDTLCVEARMTTVCVNLDTHESVPLAVEFRARFEELLERP